MNERRAFKVIPIKIEKEPYYNLIQSKVIDWSEVVVNLFDHCNMTCAFCPQDHNSRVGQSRDAILGKVIPIAEYINSNPSTDFHLHIMGGELFQDELIETGYLEIYGEFIEQLRTECPDKRLLFNFITNLVFEKTQPVIKFLDKYNLIINVSYDMAGRFKRNQLEIFKKNIEVFKTYIDRISLVITKQNIDAMIRGDDYYDYLYNTFTITWDHLIPGHNSLHVMMPAESDLYNFYRHLIDHYPRVVNVESFLGTAPNNKMACTRGNSFTIMYDDSIPTGCSGSLFLDKASTENLGSTQIIENFMEERSCFTCEFYQRCGFSCFISSDYKDLVKDLDECVFKKAFYYASNKTGYIQDANRIH